jgi:hypothetical protein
MAFLRHTPRKLKSAVEIDSIKRVMNKYVNFKDLYWWSDFQTEKVEFLDRLGDDTLVLRFDSPLDEELIETYTIVNDRFIEFDLEMVSPAEPKYPPFSFVMRVRKCSIALDKREHDRTDFPGKRPVVANISTIKVRERVADFQKSLSVKMIMEEFISKLEGVDFKRVVFKDDKEIPPAVEFVMESGRPLFIRDFSDPADFFTENESFFEESNTLALRDELRRWIQTNSANMKSIMVAPITYYPLLGDEFTIGYIVAVNKDTVMGNDMIERVEHYIGDLSETIRNGNLIESKTGGEISSVSAGGARIELADSKLVDKLQAQNVIVFEMSFKEDSPLLVSGRIVYIYQRGKGDYFVGVDFRGSRFGPQINNVLPLHIRHFRTHPER